MAQLSRIFREVLVHLNRVRFKESLKNMAANSLYQRKIKPCDNCTDMIYMSSGFPSLKMYKIFTLFLKKSVY